MDLRPSGYEPDELPDCSTPRRYNNLAGAGDRNRTGTALSSRGILSPVRLPVPPLRQYSDQQQLLYTTVMPLSRGITAYFLSLFFLLCSFGFFYNFSRYIRGYFFVTLKAHCKCPSGLRHRPELGSIFEHLGHRYLSHYLL